MIEIWKISSVFYSYGNNLLLCLCGGIASTVLVFIVSVLLSKKFNNLNISFRRMNNGDIRIISYKN